MVDISVTKRDKYTEEWRKMSRAERHQYDGSLKSYIASRAIEEGRIDPADVKRSQQSEAIRDAVPDTPSLYTSTRQQQLLQQAKAKAEAAAQRRAEQQTVTRNMTLARATMSEDRGQDYKGIVDYEQYMREQREKQYSRETPMRSFFFNAAERGVDVLERGAERLRDVPVAKYTYPYARVGVGAFSGAVLVTKATFHPVKTAKGLYTVGKSLMKTPVKTTETIGYALGTQIEKKGFAYTYGQGVGMYGMGKLIGYGVQKTAQASPVKIENVKVTLPTKKGPKLVYRGVGISVGSKGKVLVGISDKKVQFGTPKIELTPQTYKGFVPEKPVASSIVKQSIKGYPKSEFKKHDLTTSIMKDIQYKSPSVVQKKFITQVKFLSPKQVKIVINFAKSNKKQVQSVYGSFAQSQQMSKSRLPADIDIQFKTGVTQTESMTKFLATKLGNVKGGYPVRVSRQSPMLIESKVGGQWHHAVDIHTSDSSAYSTPEYAWGFKQTQSPIKIDNLPVQRLSEQGIKKGGSILGITKTGFAPAAHRIKDIGDFINIAKELGSGSKAAKLQTMFPSVKPSAVTKISLYSASASPSFSSPSVPIISPSISYSRSRSKSVSPSVNISYSRSVSPSVSRSRSVSPSVSISRPVSVSPSLSPSPSPSVSLSPSVSPSPSLSPSPSIPSYSPYTPPNTPPPTIIIPPFKLPTSRGRKKKGKKKKYKQPKLFIPTAHAASFGLKGRTPKINIKTGLGQRLIPTWKIAKTGKAFIRIQ